MPTKLPDSTAPRRRVVALAAAITCAACGAPQVSPWGERTRVPLRLYAQAPDLEQRARDLDAEAGALGLVLEHDLAITDRDGVRYVVRGYAGTDSLGRTTHACRVANEHGVILALGPPAEVDPADRATELVRVLDAGGGRAVASPGDLDRDGTIEIVLRSRRGELAIHTLGASGARAAKIGLAVPPTRLVDLGERGVGVAGDVAGPSDDAPILLEEVATPVPGGFASDTDAARRHHAARRDRFATPVEGASARDEADRRFRWAWHAIRAGAAADEVLEALAKDPGAGAARALVERRIAWLRLEAGKTRGSTRGDPENEAR